MTSKQLWVLGGVGVVILWAVALVLHPASAPEPEAPDTPTSVATMSLPRLRVNQPIGFEQSRPHGYMAVTPGETMGGKILGDKPSSCVISPAGLATFSRDKGYTVSEVRALGLGDLSSDFYGPYGLGNQQGYGVRFHFDLDEPVPHGSKLVVAVDCT